MAARSVAAEVLERVEGGAYANLLLAGSLDRHGLDERDRRLVTDLVYTTLRSARTADHLADRFLVSPPPTAARVCLRLGVAQLLAGFPPHAAVSATVAATPHRIRGLVNAVLRRCADLLAEGTPDWPSIGIELGYPDWIVDRLVADLGESEAVAALRSMNRPAEVHRRDDGYIQDPASTAVAEAVGAQAGERVLDLCAAPGGKATALAATGAHVVAAELHPNRAALVRDAARVTGTSERIGVVVADGTAPPFAPASFDRVLVDAPCSGLGVLRRRPDARGRLDAAAPERLAGLQRRLLDAAVGLVRPGGTLVYSVCTLTRVESIEVDEAVRADHPGLIPQPPPSTPWAPWGAGSVLLPQAAGTDGMCLFRYLRA